MCVNYCQLTLTLTLTLIPIFRGLRPATPNRNAFLFRGFCPQGVLSGYQYLDKQFRCEGRREEPYTDIAYWRWFVVRVKTQTPPTSHIGHTS